MIRKLPSQLDLVKYYLASPFSPLELYPADPAEMGFEVEAVAGGELGEFFIKTRVIGVDGDVVAGEGGDGEVLDGEDAFDHADFCGIEAHEGAADGIDGEGVGAGDEEAAGFGIGGHGAVAFAADDAVDDGEVADRGVAGLAFAIVVKEALVEVGDHAPAGVVAVPVAAAHDRLGVAEEEAAEFFEGDEAAAEGIASEEDAFDGAHDAVFESGFGGIGGELVAALGGGAFGVMGEPVFVGVDAHQIFEGAGEADFFMAFEFGEVDEDIRIHGGAAEHVFVTGVVMAFVGFVHVVAGAVEVAEAVEADKFAVFVEADVGVAERIAGECAF